MKMNIFQVTRELFHFARTLEGRIDSIQQALGTIESRIILGDQIPPASQIHRFEFKVFSQWGEDGIIEFLAGQIADVPRVFVEFGIGDYSECNTRYLLEHRNWSGLVIDGDDRLIKRVLRDPILARRDLQVKCAHITRDNINDLVTHTGIQGEIGLLSIDIDGNDYWVWEAITSIRPAIVVIEYNHRFGPDRLVTVPYKSDFNRYQAHFSGVYFGASLGALTALANRKGYSLVGCTSTGVNAFFVREDKRPANLSSLTVQEAYVAGKFRESRDAKGNLLYLTREEEAEILARLPLIDV